MGRSMAVRGRCDGIFGFVRWTFDGPPMARPMAPSMALRWRVRWASDGASDGPSDGALAVVRWRVRSFDGSLGARARWRFRWPSPSFDVRSRKPPFDEPLDEPFDGPSDAPSDGGSDGPSMSRKYCDFARFGAPAAARSAAASPLSAASRLSAKSSWRWGLVWSRSGCCRIALGSLPGPRRCIASLLEAILALCLVASGCFPAVAGWVFGPLQKEI